MKKSWLTRLVLALAVLVNFAVKDCQRSHAYTDSLPFNKWETELESILETAEQLPRGFSHSLEEAGNILDRWFDTSGNRRFHPDYIKEQRSELRQQLVDIETTLVDRIKSLGQLQIELEELQASNITFIDEMRAKRNKTRDRYVDLSAYDAQIASVERAMKACAVSLSKCEIQTRELKLRAETPLVDPTNR